MADVEAAILEMDEAASACLFYSVNGGDLDGAERRYDRAIKSLKRTIRAYARSQKSIRRPVAKRPGSPSPYDLSQSPVKKGQAR